MWWVLVLEAIFSVALAAWLYSRYGQFIKNYWYVPLLTITGWSISFCVVFLVTNDIGSVAHCDVPLCANSTQNTGDACEEDSLVSPTTMRITWRVLYWSTMGLTYLLFPLIQTYCASGHFAVIDRLMYSVKSNLVFYAIEVIILVGGAAIYFILNGFKFSGLIGIAMAAANAFGLFLLISLMGHGLVNVPRRLWHRGSLHLQIARYHFQVATLQAKRSSSYKKLETNVKLLHKASELVSSTDLYRPHIEKMISKCRDEYDKHAFGEGEPDVTYSGLSSLHWDIISSTHRVRMHDSMFDDCLKYVVQLQDIKEAKDQKLWRIRWTLPRKHFPSLDTNPVFKTIEFVWYAYLKQLSLRTLSVLCGILSVALVWSELVLFVCAIDLSPFSLTIRALHNIPDILLEIVIAIPVVYMAVCAFSSLFRLRLFNYYNLVPHRTSDSRSLIFSASYLCRLITPLAYNYIKISHFENSTFVQVMGPIDLSTLGSYFQTFFPMVILPFCLATIFNLYSRILELLKIKNFQFDEDSVEDETTKQGALLVRTFVTRATAPPSPLSDANEEAPSRPSLTLPPDYRTTLSDSSQELSLIDSTIQRFWSTVARIRSIASGATVSAPSASSSSAETSSSSDVLEVTPTSNPPKAPKPARTMFGSRNPTSDDPWADIDDEINQL